MLTTFPMDGQIFFSFFAEECNLNFFVLGYVCNSAFIYVNFAFLTDVRSLFNTAQLVCARGHGFTQNFFLFQNTLPLNNNYAPQ